MKHHLNALCSAMINNWRDNMFVCALGYRNCCQWQMFKRFKCLEAVPFYLFICFHMFFFLPFSFSLRFFYFFYIFFRLFFSKHNIPLLVFISELRKMCPFIFRWISFAVCLHSSWYQYLMTKKTRKIRRRRERKIFHVKRKQATLKMPHQIEGRHSI